MIPSLFVSRKPSQRGRLLVWNQPSYLRRVCLVHDGGLAEIPFSLPRLLRQNVTRVRLVATNLPCSRDAKPLVGAPVCPDLWHDEPFLRFLQTFVRCMDNVASEANRGPRFSEVYGTVAG